MELPSLYTVPLSAVNGLSRLTTTSNGQARPIRKFSNRPITFESNRIWTADSNSNRISKLRRSLLTGWEINTSMTIEEFYFIASATIIPGRNSINHGLTAVRPGTRLLITWPTARRTPTIRLNFRQFPPGRHGMPRCVAKRQLGYLGNRNTLEASTHKSTCRSVKECSSSSTKLFNFISHSPAGCSRMDRIG